MLRSLALACAGALALMSTPAWAGFSSDRISVTTVGSGSDVVLIPGLTSSPRIWQDAVKAVPGRRYHLVQVKGFAGTPADGNATGDVAAPVAEEIARYIETEHLKAPALVGHSMGGTIAMIVAVRHPKDVSRVMVVDMMPFMGLMFGGPTATPSSVRPIAEQIRAAMAADPATLSAEQRARIPTPEQTIATMIKTESLRAGPIADARASDRNAVANSYAELITTDLRPELARITVPLTVLYVRPNGAPFSDAQMDAMYQAMYATAPKATLKRIPDSYHFIMLDQPKRFAEELKAFLGG